MTSTRHLIHIGFPKTGSTSLQAWFAAHTRCQFAPEGIGGYYHAPEIAAGAVAQQSQSPLWHVTSSEALSIPPTTATFSMEDPAGGPLAMPLTEIRERVCLALQRMFGPATILIVTRGFRAVLASGYSEYIRVGGRRPIADEMSPEAADHVATRFDYDAVVSLYERAFGEEAVIVLPYEQLRDNPSAFVSVLEGRLGLDSEGPAMSSLNPSLSPATIYWYRRLSIAMEALARKAGPRLGSRLWAAYVRQIYRDRFRRPIHLVHRLLPRREVTAEDVAHEAVEACRGRAASLGKRELFAPYAAEYLNER